MNRDYLKYLYYELFEAQRALAVKGATDCLADMVLSTPETDEVNRAVALAKNQAQFQAARRRLIYAEKALNVYFESHGHAETPSLPPAPDRYHAAHALPARPALYTYVGCPDEHPISEIRENGRPMTAGEIVRRLNNV